MRFWDWALAAYGRPGVAEACLELQDRFARNTAYLLWAGWAAGEGRAPGDALLAEGAVVARGWETEVLGPLRAARRHLKPPRPPVADAAREALRERVKTAELDAERLLMETLEAITAPAGDGGPLAAMARAADAWGGPACAPALAVLAAAIAGRDEVEVAHG